MIGPTELQSGCAGCDVLTLPLQYLASCALISITPSVRCLWLLFLVSGSRSMVPIPKPVTRISPGSDDYRFGRVGMPSQTRVTFSER